MIAKRKVLTLYGSTDNTDSRNESSGYSSSGVGRKQERKKFKLPTIEIVKFSGNVRDWLQFWNQFRKIHEDNTIDNEDKFQYLLQSVEAGSRAFDLVSSFPPTRENYSKTIETLKSRYGKDELQVEVYVRELLNLVLKNAVSGKEKLTLASLYDKLEAHMRALETLGVTSEKCAAMLFPLVESAVPEEILRAWQRSSSTGGAKDSKERLVKLMEFLAAEVESEERISMAVAGFSLQGDNGKNKHAKTKNVLTSDIPTAMGLFTQAEDSAECIFCKNNNHASAECYKAKKLLLTERRAMVKDANCCFNCLKRGHSYKRCKVKLRCPWCGRKHVLLMCPENSTKGETTSSHTENSNASPKCKTEEVSLASFVDMPYVHLQTLRLKVINGSKECTVRALIDSGSQRSYITNDRAKKLNYTPIDSRELTHALFGGVKSSPQHHDVYTIHLRSLKGDYACNFKVMGQETICESLHSVKSDNCLSELQLRGIVLSDNGENRSAIDLLIGADISGKLLTGRKQDLKSGMIAFETHFGWTVMGKDSMAEPHTDTVLLLNMLAIEEATVSDLWRLDILGIEDPIQRVSKQERQIDVKKRFLETTYINEEGKYEVKLPWIPDHSPISSNKMLAAKRLENTMAKLNKNNIFNEYDKVFREWEQDGVIEKVPLCEMDDFSHYLPHRPVVKPSSSSTKIRPVFDASAREKNFPSLNQCLETGPNMIELIPSVLLRFRENNIGVIADIKRAFLQISVAPEERNYLRFWWKRDGEMVTFRHRRLVFGVTCSPFLLGATIELHLDNVLKDLVDASVDTSILLKMKERFYSDNCVTSVDSTEELHRFIDGSTRVLKTALSWLKDLINLENVKIPRQIGSINKLSNVSFHAFADANCLAYAAAVFIRVENANSVDVALIGGKTRIAPNKDITIPRLELLAAAITARLADSLVKAMKIENPKIEFWSDSSTVLS